MVGYISLAVHALNFKETAVAAAGAVAQLTRYDDTVNRIFEERQGLQIMKELIV